MTMKIPLDAREKLEECAEFHVSTMTAEVVRAIRKRAQRKQEPTR
jgi:hypothetical protein